MGPVRGDANGRAADGEVVGEVADLARLPRDLHLLLGVAILLELVNVRDDVEGEGVGKDLVLGHVALSHEDGAGTLLELVHAWLTGAGGGLVGGHDDLFEAKELVERPKGHEANGSGAVGIGNELGSLGGLGVDFGNAERNILLVSEGGRVVNDDGAIVTLGNVSCMLESKVAIDSEEDHVALPGLVFLEQLDLNVAKAGGAGAAGTAARAKDAQLADGEGGLLQTSDDLLPDGTGGTDDTDRVGHAEGGGDGGGGTSDERGVAAGGAARTGEGRCGRAGTGEGYGRGGGKGLGAGEGESSCGHGEDAEFHRWQFGLWLVLALYW
mmetsp:Transcript_22265/g.63887  ORF Transcript_22265/g.63887 Transcript_22265/m.63887 type:complete len:325 (+) Transcript_22265:2158-3132(+)